MAEKFQPLFVGGSGRSGTTIAINLLNCHSQVHASLPREIKYLTSRSGLIDLVYGRSIGLEEGATGVRNNLLARLLPIIGKSKLHYFQENLHGVWWSEVGKKGKARGLIQGIDEQALISAEKNFLANFRSQPEVAARELFYALSSKQLKSPEIKYFADSTPVNIMQANFISRLFPEALFINMVRDGRDVALSVANEKWGPSDPFKALGWWANRVLTAHKSLELIPKDQQITLRLEDLVYRNRDLSYDNLLKFLALESEVPLADFFESELIKDKLNEGLWKQKVGDPRKFEKRYLEILERLKDKGIVVERYY
jgi:hypothetical protein